MNSIIIETDLNQILHKCIVLIAKISYLKDRYDFKIFIWRGWWESKRRKTISVIVYIFTSWNNSINIHLCTQPVFFFISFDLYSDSLLHYYNKNTSFLRKYHQNPFYFLHIIIPCNLYLFIMYIYVHNLQTDIKDAQKRFKENS